jgi:mannosyl-glycoprotein endo-beta-N-acetylglucosaminidase
MWWRSATEDDIQYYLNPDNLNEFQFLDLAMPSDVDYNVLVTVINGYLSDANGLAGKGAEFVAAGIKYGINPIYLAAHACHESGFGTSNLSNGKYRNEEGEQVYNLFGIGAVDSDPEGRGSVVASNNGWTSIDAAIEGGAEWISKNYTQKGQDTLYKMRWNPDDVGEHQYATDVAWAQIIANGMSKRYEQISYASMSFDRPGYK